MSAQNISSRALHFALAWRHRRFDCTPMVDSPTRARGVERDTRYGGMSERQPTLRINARRARGVLLMLADPVCEGVSVA